MNILKRLFRGKDQDSFSLKQISDTEFQIKFDDGRETTISREDAMELLKSEDTTITSFGFDFGEENDISVLFKNLLNRFLDDAKAKTSSAGERVTIHVLEEWEKELPENMVQKFGKYDVVGDSGRLFQTESFRIEFSRDSKIDLRELFKVLVQLSWSGTHATNEDTLRYYDVVGQERPEKYRIEQEATVNE